MVSKNKEPEKARWVKLVLKSIITILCFWYISTKIDFAKVFQALKDADWLWLSISVLIYALSKVIAAFRLNIYFNNINLHLSHLKNLRLYWLGMFYNLFLPGSISGDAYKVVILNKRLGAPYKKTSAAVLLDRFSGLLGLGFILCACGIIVLDNPIHNTLLIGGWISAAALLYFVIRRFFKDFVGGFFSTFFWGIIVQGIQVVGLYFILSALHVNTSQQQWLFIFLLASAVSVLPISLGGGLGTRELVFAEGANYFHLDPHVGVIISLLFYLTTVAGSLPGSFFIFHDPLKGVKNGKKITVEQYT